MSTIPSSPASAVSASAPAPAPPPHVVEDCMGIVQLLSDGTVRRSLDYSHLPMLRHVPSDLPVQWKDVVYDAGNGLRLRVYRPTSNGFAGNKQPKLPVLIYFHGGGFCIASFEWPNFHAGALRLASELPALVLSADYRLAPEHRLPAAHRDAETVLSWLRDQAAAGTDAWLAECADFGRVFVCGDSAGGNMVHHVTVRLGSGALALGHRVRVVGCVILWPYFGGEERTASEAEADAMAPSSEFDPGRNFDQMWRLALPAGATRDHPAANHFGWVFVCGDSAGGNMVHHVAARLGSGALALGDRVRVVGYVILWPYFGGEERTASEAMAPSSEFDPGRNFDQMWRLALPDGATRDHPAANPFGPESAPLDDVPFPPVLVAKAGRDRMRDRVAEYVARLRTMGKPVVLAEFEGQGHGFFVFAPFGDASDELVRVVRQFVCTSTAAGHG